MDEASACQLIPKITSKFLKARWESGDKSLFLSSTLWLQPADIQICETVKFCVYFISFCLFATLAQKNYYWGFPDIPWPIALNVGGEYYSSKGPSEDSARVDASFFAWSHTFAEVGRNDTLQNSL